MQSSSILLVLKDEMSTPNLKFRFNRLKSCLSMFNSSAKVRLHESFYKDKPSFRNRKLYGSGIQLIKSKP